MNSSLKCWCKTCTIPIILSNHYIYRRFIFKWHPILSPILIVLKSVLLRVSVTHFGNWCREASSIGFLLEETSRTWKIPAIYKTSDPWNSSFDLHSSKENILSLGRYFLFFLYIRYFLSNQSTHYVQYLNANSNCVGLWNIQGIQRENELWEYLEYSWNCIFLPREMNSQSFESLTIFLIACFWPVSF